MEPRCTSRGQLRATWSHVALRVSRGSAAGHRQPVRGGVEVDPHGVTRRGSPRCLEHSLAITLDVNNAMRYAQRVLQSFRDKDTERVWRRQRLRKLDESTQRMALRKLLILDAADALADLRVPSGNRLEKLRGDRGDEYSIRVNRQWRICFRWTGAGPEDVEIVDYH